MQITGFNVERVAGSVAYGVLGSVAGVDELDVDVGIDNKEGFSYFHIKFGVPYNFFLKKTISSGHVLAIAVLEPNKLMAFARFEKLEEKVERIYRGELKIIKPPIFLLRSIEVHSSYRNTGIGRVLFALAARNLCADVLTRPDNPEAKRFFRDKLMFGNIDRMSGLDSTKYPGHLMLSHAKAAMLLSDVTKRFPRMVLPDLIDMYEMLQFRVNMGKSVLLEEVCEFETVFQKHGGMLDDGSQNKMHTLLKSMQQKCGNL